MRKASLVNRTETFLLEVLNAGYTQAEVEQALQLALDHWREIQLIPEIVPSQIVRFNGSHDLAVDWIAAVFPEIAPSFNLKLTFSGSLSGLIALAEGKADLAGCHLWDEEQSTYNVPFISRLLPGKKTALVTLANRRLGLILPSGNPMGINQIIDLTKPGVKFINRQNGSGTRVWLDSNLRHLGISPLQIQGFTWEVATHSAVARAIAMQQANAGIGLEASAITYGLFFIPLTLERYDLVIPEDKYSFPPIQELVKWLSSSKAKEGISNLGGYDTKQTGHLQWVE